MFIYVPTIPTDRAALDISGSIIDYFDVIIATTVSKNGILIRLTEERWKHIVLMHPSLSNKRAKVLSTVKNPDYIFKGSKKELLATSKLSSTHYLVVVYKETTSDGFIITAFDISDVYWLFKKEMIWNKPS